jgi:hypothetical protein
MRTRLLCALGVLGLAACQAPATNAPTTTLDQGALTLSLIGVSPRGDTYRLRNAIFDVSGCPDSSNGMYPGGLGGTGGSVNQLCTAVSLSTEDAPDATTITQRVLPGSYTVSLRDGWRLERLAGMTWEPVQTVVLISPATQYVYVWDQSYVEVRYSFGVDGTLIDFQHGDIAITIDVRRPEESGNTAGFPSAGAAGAIFFPTPAGSGAVPEADAGTTTTAGQGADGGSGG